MPLSTDAHVTIFLADFANTDSSQKVNALGAGFMITGLQPNGFTAPQSVTLLVDIPGRYAGDEMRVTLELRDERSNSIVTVPGPSGANEALRIEQLAKVERMAIPGVWLPSDLWMRYQLQVGFQNGLPLAGGVGYVWHVEIDGQHRKDWTCRFYVPGPAPAPVFGGPVGPAEIPDVEIPSTTDE